jgi:molybdate transport system ATP-binding protein
MDEPLASLDEARKQEILPYLERLRDQAGVPIVYVSHAAPEVARLATSLVVLEAGRLAAVGPTAEILSRLDVASFSHSREGGAEIEATVARHDDGYGLTVLSTRAGELHVPRLLLGTGARLRAYVRARDVMLSAEVPKHLSVLNVLPGRVTEIGPTRGDGDHLGASVEVRLACGGEVLVACVTRKSAEALALAPGRTIYALIQRVSVTAGGASGPP